MGHSVPPHLQAKIRRIEHLVAAQAAGSSVFFQNEWQVVRTDEVEHYHPKAPHIRPRTKRLFRDHFRSTEVRRRISYPVSRERNLLLFFSLGHRVEDATTEIGNNTVSIGREEDIRRIEIQVNYSDGV